MEKLELIILTHFYIFQKHRNSEFCGFFAHKDLEKKKEKGQWQNCCTISTYKYTV